MGSSHYSKGVMKKITLETSHKYFLIKVKKYLFSFNSYIKASFLKIPFTVAGSSYAVFASVDLYEHRPIKQKDSKEKQKQKLHKSFLKTT